jgi:imidazoleglycerol phosphate synthase glutamine amidotransferase subunit HisH
MIPFIRSEYAFCDNPDNFAAKAVDPDPFAVVLRRDNLRDCPFHWEKSQATGSAALSHASRRAPKRSRHDLA